MVLKQKPRIDVVGVVVPLLAGLRLANGAPVVDEEPADPRFAVPAGGLYWQVDGAKGQVRSRSLWDSRLPPPGKVAADSWQARRIAGPFGQALLVVQREVRLSPDAPGVTVRVAYDRAQLAPARREFGRELGLFLALNVARTLGGSVKAHNRTDRPEGGAQVTITLPLAAIALPTTGHNDHGR